MDKAIEDDLNEYEKHIRKPEQISSLSEVPRYRNEETASTFLLVATMLFFVFGVAMLLEAPPVGAGIIVISLFMLFLYIGLVRHDKKLLQEEQARIQSNIDNFEIVKDRKMECHRQMLLEQKATKLEELKRRNCRHNENKYLGIHCPMCGSYAYEKISTINRMVSVELAGAASAKIGKQYKCKKCGHMW